MAVSSRQVKNKRDSNGVLTGRPGTVYDVNIKYTAPDGKKKSYAKKGFATKKEATQHEAEMKTKLQNPGQIASITSQRKQTVASYLMVCAMRTDTFAAVYGFTRGSDPAFDMLELTLDDGSEETVSIEPNTPFLHVIPGRLKEVQNITLSGSKTNTKQNIGRGWNARPDSVEDTYPMNDSIWSRVHAMLDCGHWVPEYEDGVREFELEDSKRSDLPGDFFQWPRYYSAFVDYFSGMNADLSYLDWDSFWTKDLSEDGQTLIVTMTPGNGDHAALTLSYSLQTQEISVGDNNGL